MALLNGVAMRSTEARRNTQTSARSLPQNVRGHVRQSAQLQRLCIANCSFLQHAMTLHNIPDLMASLTQLNEHAVQQIRKTAETPPRLSVIDLVAAVTGFTPHAAANAVLRLKAAYPEVSSLNGLYKFSGRRQRDTPVTDARGAIELIMLLPGKTAAIARQSAANVVVRYLGAMCL